MPPLQQPARPAFAGPVLMLRGLSGAQARPPHLLRVPLALPATPKAPDTRASACTHRHGCVSRYANPVLFSLQHSNRR